MPEKKRYIFSTYLKMAICALSFAYAMWGSLLFLKSDYRFLIFRHHEKIEMVQKLITHQLSEDTAFLEGMAQQWLQADKKQRTLQANGSYRFRHSGLVRIEYIESSSSNTISDSDYRQDTSIPLSISVNEEQARSAQVAARTHSNVFTRLYKISGNDFFDNWVPIIDEQKELHGYVVGTYALDKLIDKILPSDIYHLGIALNTSGESLFQLPNQSKRTKQELVSLDGSPIRASITYDTHIYGSLDNRLFLTSVLLCHFLWVCCLLSLILYLNGKRKYRHALYHLIHQLPDYACFVPAHKRIQVNNQKLANLFEQKHIQPYSSAHLSNFEFNIDDILDGVQAQKAHELNISPTETLNLECSYLPLYDWENHVSGALMIGHSVDKYKMSEEALLREKEYNSYIVASSPNIIVTTLPDGTVISANPATCEASGYQFTEVLGHNWWHLMYPGALKKEGRKMRLEVQEKHVTNYNNHIMAKDGQIRTISWNSITRYNLHNEVTEYILIGIDITEITERAQEETDRQKMEALGQLAGGVAHELNNLLQPIMLFSEIEMDRVKKNDPENEKSLSNLQKIFHHGNRSAEIVSDILTFARRKSQPSEQIDISATSSEAIKFVRNMLPITIKVNAEGFDQKGLFVNIRETDLYQIITNLIQNASHAMNKSGEISIKMQQIASGAAELRELDLAPHVPYMMISVCDTGHGIEANKLKKIFDPFYTTKDIGKGTGLGLSIVYGLMRDCDGGIHVESTVNKGTCFKLYFPLSYQKS